MKKELRVATISDIHLGHRNNDAPFIIKNLKAAMPPEFWLGLDILWLAGDVFDMLLNRPHEYSMDIDMFAAWLLWEAKKYNVKVRILEGTKSHDWEQSQIFQMLNDGGKIGCDLMYVRTVDIVYEADLDINVLYIPDEWRPNPEDTYAEVLELMKAKGLDKVDFAIMHGQFEYQLPPVVKAPKHDSAKYLAIVKYLIFIGHVHLFSRFDRIIAQGSFDRLVHGEEGPKGFVKATVYLNGDYEIEFVENVGARKFVTVECSGLELEDTLEEIKNKVSTLPDHSFVRVSLNKGHPLLENMHELVLRWPLLTWSKIRRDDKEVEEEQKQEALNETDFVAIQITRDNIETLLLPRIQARGVSQTTLDMARDAIQALR